VRCSLRKGWITFALLIVAMVLAPVGPRAQWKTPWSYDGEKGPGHWGDLDPDFAACKAGREQSPIDIRHAQKAELPALRFEYKSGPLKIINNGYTAVRVNYAPGNGNFLVVGDQRYELTQFHFHRPSEEYIHGKSYDMVAHLMHKSSDGKVAAVAVLLNAGSANSTIQQLWQDMPMTPGKEEEIAGAEMNPAGLLPRDTGYYTYMGSLTAPPCTEGVTWFVLKTPVDISTAQINAFARLYPHDVRPVQPLCGRVVKESR
jgi:carbonic anhydrase